MRKTQKKRKQYFPIQINSSIAHQSFPFPDISNAYFPYQPYPEQISLIQKIHQAIYKGKNALIQSPTGTGKTLCMLVSSMSALMNIPTENKTNRPKIYYLTRTHSQIAQVVNELKKTAYECRLNIIGSRQSMCINKNLEILKGRNLDRACQQMCNQKLCKYKEDTTETLRSQKIFMKKLCIEEFREKGKKQFYCPYYASKQATQSTNLTILPYNYLLDWNLLEKYHLNLKNAVLIFDEAHNIDSLAEEGSSFELTLDGLSSTVNELVKLEQQLKCRYLHKKFQSDEEDQKIISNMKYFVMNLHNQFKLYRDSSNSDKQQTTLTNENDILEFIRELTQHRSPHTSENVRGLTLDNFQDYIDQLKKSEKIFCQKKAICEYFQYYSSFMQKIYEIMDGNQSEDYLLILTYPKSGTTSLKFHCLSPAHAFLRIKNHRPRSIILCSGTLSPLESWETDLGVHFECKMKVNSFIQNHQLSATVLSKNSSNEVYDFSFHMKKRKVQYQSLSEELGKLEQIVPNGIVVAFSTYQLLEKTMPYCVKLNKKIYYESKTSNYEDVYKQYSKQCKSNGAFLFIIMKGRFAEGINFNDELCRCLLVVGIPFLPMMDPKIVRKRKYLESKYDHQYAEQWYLNQTFRALNQTIGRVIRSKTDYGCIILVDQRYERGDILHHFPEWFQNSLREKSGAFDNQIQKYFADKKWQWQIQRQIQKQIEEEGGKIEKTEHQEKLLQKTLNSRYNFRHSPTLSELLQQETPIKQKKPKKLRVIQQNYTNNDKINKKQAAKNRLPENKPVELSIDHETNSDVNDQNPMKTYFPWLSVNYFLEEMDLQENHQGDQNVKQLQTEGETSKGTTKDEERQPTKQKREDRLSYIKLPKKLTYETLF